MAREEEALASDPDLEDEVDEEHLRREDLGRETVLPFFDFFEGMAGAGWCSSSSPDGGVRSASPPVSGLGLPRKGDEGEELEELEVGSEVMFMLPGVGGVWGNSRL